MKGLATTVSFVLAALAGSPCLAGTYKCTRPDGTTTYQQTACPNEAQAVQIEAKARPATEDAATEDNYWSLQNQMQRLKARTSAPKKQPAKKSRAPQRPQQLEIRNAIVGREVIKGMNQDEVREALGPPTSTYQGEDGYVSWDYRGYDSHENYRSKTLRFQGGLLDGWSDYNDPAAKSFETDKGRWLE